MATFKKPQIRDGKEGCRLCQMQAASDAAEARIVPASALDDPMFSYAFAPATVGCLISTSVTPSSFPRRCPGRASAVCAARPPQHEAKAAHEDIASQRLKLIALAKSVFADWYLVHEAIRINRVNQDLPREFRQITETKYSTGLASKQDALQADLEFNMLAHRAICSSASGARYWRPSTSC